MIVAVRVPELSPDESAPMLMLAAPIPDAGFKVTQDWSAEALQEIVPPPVFVTFNVCNGGACPPATPLKEKLVGLRVNTGGEARRSETETVRGELAAPGEVIVILP